ncbi:MAG: DUF2357 domain-containing protein [Desulforhopalus sp.]
MASKKELCKETVVFYDEFNTKICEMTLAVLCHPHSKLLVRIPEEEAVEFGEERIQLLESTTYHYEINSPQLQLEEKNGIVERSPFAAETQDKGTITTGNLTGLMTFRVQKMGVTTGSCRVEVRSKKINYRDEYQAMLKDITDHSIELLLRLPAQTEAKLTTDPFTEPYSIQQRFFFIRALLTSRDFTDAIEQIIARPHVSLKVTYERVSSRKGFRGGEAARQLRTGRCRTPLPNLHPIRNIHGSLTSLPNQITSSTSEETIDTPENRFVKYVLKYMDNLLISIEETIIAIRPQPAWSTVFIERELLPLRSKMEQVLSMNFFHRVGEISGLELGSPVLQRKLGYREVLQIWLKVNAAARLAWKGGEDLHQGGQRDIPTLYEYWVFFNLWSIIEKLCGKKLKAATKELFETARDGFGLKLRSGNIFSTGGISLVYMGKPLKLQFAYNRTFTVPPLKQTQKRLEYSCSYPAAGSWTRQMRPDFTISFWDEGLTHDEAELDNKICHIHFDAKYSITSLSKAFGKAQESIGSIKAEERTGRYRRGDLLKMHSYRDAIRRTHGAYIIYPGTSASSLKGHKEYHAWVEYHEILPGLGAFQLAPGSTSDQSAMVIHSFLSDVLDQFTSKGNRLKNMNDAISIINN